MALGRADWSNDERRREMIGTVSTEMLQHVLESFAQGARITLHVDVLKGFNNHHKAESAFKVTRIAGSTKSQKENNDVKKKRTRLARWGTCPSKAFSGITKHS